MPSALFRSGDVRTSARVMVSIMFFSCSRLILRSICQLSDFWYFSTMRRAANTKKRGFLFPSATLPCPLTKRTRLSTTKASRLWRRGRPGNLSAHYSSIQARSSSAFARSGGSYGTPPGFPLRFLVLNLRRIPAGIPPPPPDSLDNAEVLAAKHVPPELMALQIIPIVTASLFSRLTYTWITPIMVLRIISIASFIVLR